MAGTIRGCRRLRTPPARRAAGRDPRFARRIGIAGDNLVDVALLEHCVREVLNRSAERRMAVLRPSGWCSRTIRRSRSSSSRRSTIRKIRRPARAWCRSGGSCSSSATISWRCRRRSSSALRQGARCVCATRISSPAARWRRMQPAKCPCCVAPRRGDPQRRRARRAQGQEHPALGRGRACAARRGAPVRSPVRPGGAGQGRRLPGRPQSALARDHRPTAASSPRSLPPPWRGRAVRAPGLFLP